jgi:hypothetical protein
VLTAIEPFHTFSTDSKQLADTRTTYELHSEAEAARYLAEAESKAKALGVECNLVQVEHEHPYRAIIDTATKSGLRSDRHGIAWPSRAFQLLSSAVRQARS